ncbi:calcium-binding protein [Rhizobium herbae]|uniref:Ca2+-binding RTX toxin-like protein n=1 Tax=Rhizobium herbae TaxID=508661 RepID=A0ABS4ENL2_9HYPH|nr:calcium-binding protein [Rhizobium herbae]MBP1859543.1 Ca2+-binding RTX toxin-like protein [Rhizobium herbae]
MAYFYSTAGVDKLIGGSEDDFFFFWSGYMTKPDNVDGGAGRNALVLVNDTTRLWSVATGDWPIFSKVVGIALLSERYQGSVAAGFKLTFDDNTFKANGGSHFIIDASEVALDGASLQLNASSVTNMSFDIFGSSGVKADASFDNLRAGSRNDRFVYYANSLERDVIDGGAGTDTLVLSGAGYTTTKNGQSKTDPNGYAGLWNIKNIEEIVIMDLSAGQSRTIDFGFGGLYKGRNAISITTDRNYGTDKAAASIDGRLIVDGSGMNSNSSLTVKGGNAGDLLIGGAANDYLSGGKGNDILIGGGGVNSLSGGLGNDLFLANHDLYVGDYDIQWGGSGYATMSGGEGNDTFEFAVSFWPIRDKDVISGGAGIDTIKLWGAQVPKSMLDSATISGIEVIDIVGIGPTFQVTQHFLTKNHNENGQLRIQNSAESWGNVTIDASSLTDAEYSVHIAVRSSGKETLTGGMGNDVFDYSLIRKGSGLTKGDTIIGGGGFDTILVSEGRNTILGPKISGVEKLKVVSKSDSGNKTSIIIGTTEALSIDGRKLDANDTLIAQGYFQDPKTGKVTEAKASLLIIGGDGDDLLTGGRAGDKLYGGDGDDILTGNKGADRLTGGNGADHFVFANASESLPTKGARDFIADFDHKEGDKIHFLHEGSAYSFIGSGAFHGKAGEVRSFVSGSNTHVQLDADGDGVADLGIGLSGKISLTQSDFIL